MDYPTKEKLLASIQSDMKLDRAFFLKAFGYELSFPGFAEIAIRALEDAGCSKARAYYERIIFEYEENQKDGLKPITKWLSDKSNADYEKRCGLAKEGSEDVRQNLLKQKKMLLMRLKENLQT